MKGSRKPYPDEFKQEAVRLLREQRLPRSQVARDLGVEKETLRRWARELVSDSADSKPAPFPRPLAQLNSLGCAVKTSSCDLSAIS